jgi:hypothetical protein
LGLRGEAQAAAAMAAWQDKVGRFNAMLVLAGSWGCMAEPLKAQVTMEALVAFPRAEPLVIHRGGNFILMYSGGRKTAKLHKAWDGCFWSTHEVRDSDALEDMPEPGAYTSKCLNCWPEDRKLIKEDGSDNSASCSESDSSNSE